MRGTLTTLEFPGCLNLNIFRRVQWEIHFVHCSYYPYYHTIHCQILCLRQWFISSVCWSCFLNQWVYLRKYYRPGHQSFSCFEKYIFTGAIKEVLSILGIFEYHRPGHHCFEKYICTGAIKEAELSTADRAIIRFFMAVRAFKSRQPADTTLQQLQTVQKAQKREVLFSFPVLTLAFIEARKGVFMPPHLVGSTHSRLGLASVPSLCAFSTTTLLHQNVCPQSTVETTGREETSLL